MSNNSEFSGRTVPRKFENVWAQTPLVNQSICSVFVVQRVYRSIEQFSEAVNLFQTPSSSWQTIDRIPRAREVIRNWLAVKGCCIWLDTLDTVVSLCLNLSLESTPCFSLTTSYKSHHPHIWSSHASHFIFSRWFTTLVIHNSFTLIPGAKHTSLT